MDVFSKSYLEEVVENQGKLFEYAQDHGVRIEEIRLRERNKRK